jgi:hypothetical protein
MRRTSQRSSWRFTVLVALASAAVVLLTAALYLLVGGRYLLRGDPGDVLAMMGTALSTSLILLGWFVALFVEEAAGSSGILLSVGLGVALLTVFLEVFTGNWWGLGLTFVLTVESFSAPPAGLMSAAFARLTQLAHRADPRSDWRTVRREWRRMREQGADRVEGSDTDDAGPRENT